MKLALPLALALALACVVPPAAGADPLQAFPPADRGFVRDVIAVPAVDDEADRRVELQVGKTVSVDAAHRHFFGGKLVRETLKGWGYDRYVLEALGPMAGTLIAVDPAAPKLERFVALAGEPMLLRYNSRMPIVVYVPDDVEVRYRLWRAAPEAVPTPRG